MAFSAMLFSKQTEIFQVQLCITLHNHGHWYRKSLTTTSKVSEIAILAANGLDEMGGTSYPVWEDCFEFTDLRI